MANFSLTKFFEAMRGFRTRPASHRNASAIAVAFIAYILAQDAFAVSVAIEPNCRLMEANQTQQFQATVADATNDDVIWTVDGVRGGAPEIGLITEEGLYTAPSNMDRETNVVIVAMSVEDETEAARVNVCNQIYSRPGTTRYVAINGSNSNAGTSQAPWRTIQHAVNHVQAGDTILVRNGIYNETVTISASGSAADGFITVMEAPGENAVIDGAGLVQQPIGMQGLITLNNVSYVRVKGFELRNYKSGTEFIVAGVLVQGSGQHIEVRDNYIHDIEANNLPSSGAANALGIAVYGQGANPLRNIIVDGNELFDLKTGTSESLTIGGNVEGWQVTNNIVHDNNFIGIDATGYYNSGSEYDRARHGWIAGNSVYNLSIAGNQALTYAAAAIGIYIDGGRDITVERNTVDANDGGIWLLSEHPGKATADVIVRNNLVRFNQDAGVLIGGYDATASGGAVNCTVTNNTLFQNNARNVAGINAGELQISFNAEDIQFENNILFAGQKGYAITRFSPAASSSVDIGHNIYFTTSGGSFTRWFWINQNFYNDGSSPDFTAFQTASGDANSIVQDPDFVDVSTLDLRLQEGSPGIDSGNFSEVFGIQKVGLVDHAGNRRFLRATVDRGAYEHTP